MFIEIYRVRPGILHPEPEKMQFFRKIKKNCLVLRKNNYLCTRNDDCSNRPGGFPETVLTVFVMAININSNPNIREYRVMYLFGAWVTKEIIFAESDEEAKYDAAESAESLKNWPYAVALFCGNRKVVSYK